jgi:site-specific DNA-methyltransferase (adenine-specific)
MNNIIQGDCLEVLKTYPDNHFTSVITDPPYGLSFMGKKWDYDVPSIDIWKECLRVLKPGGTMLCFAGTRTQHRMAVNIEDAGFIIKDCLMYLYGSGFPKSLNVGKAVDKVQGNEREVIGKKNNISLGKGLGSNFRDDNWKPPNDINDDRLKLTKGTSDFEGYGTALKPAYEPIILAMKPNDGSYAENALKWGVSGINIDAGRIIPSLEDAKSMERANSPGSGRFKTGKFGICGTDGFGNKSEPYNTTQGRFPANIILDEEAGQMLDQQSGISKSSSYSNLEQKKYGDVYQWSSCETKYVRSGGHSDSGGASRFFYCAKASKSERNAGCEGLEEKVSGGMPGTADQTLLTGSGNIRNNKAHNHHPTVKPLSLMKYIINLIMPPKDGLILDPFAGSGTTILAAKRLGYNAIGIELDEEYCNIANARINNG